MSLKLNAEPKITLFMTAGSALLALAIGYLVQPDRYLSGIMEAAFPTFLSCLASFAIYRIATSKKLSAGNAGVFSFIASVLIFAAAALALSIFGLNSLFGLVSLSLFGVMIGALNLIRITGRLLDDKREQECKALILEVENINERYIEAHGKEIPNLEQHLEAVYLATNSRSKKMLIEQLLRNIRSLE